MGAQKHFFRRLRNLAASLTAYIFRKKHGIRNHSFYVLCKLICILIYLIIYYILSMYSESSIGQGEDAELMWTTKRFALSPSEHDLSSNTS